MVVDAARQWWAAHRQRQPRPTSRPKSTHKATVARLALFLPLVVVGAILLCAATGFTATRISKGHVEAEQRAALQQALDEFHTQFGDMRPTTCNCGRLRAAAASPISASTPIRSAKPGARCNPCMIPAAASSGGLVGPAIAALSLRWTGCGACWQWSAPSWVYARLSPCTRPGMCCVRSIAAPRTCANSPPRTR